MTSERTHSAARSGARRTPARDAAPPFVTFADVEAAAQRIRGHVLRTPVLTSATLDRELSARLFLKCENLQRVGAFKARGACNAVFSLDDATASRGVITHSSGNHAAALAYAASVRGVPCRVVMPDTAPAIKVDNVRQHGAEIRFCKPAERDATCAAWQIETKATLVHPFEDPRVVAGQGTAALELLSQVPELDLVVVPVGGGGLCAGTAITTAAVRPSARVVAAEPLAVDDAARSMASGVRQPRVDGAKTWADGLTTGIGAPNFEVLRAHHVRVVTVDEDEIVAATRALVQQCKLVVEPSAGTVLAAVRAIAGEIRGLRVGMILSGGNTDFAWYG